VSLFEKPRKLPAEYDARAVEQVIQDIYNAINSGFMSVRYQVRREEPDKVYAHMTVIADGTNWDPGSGSGMYRRNGSNTAWVFIG
jgi:hypothetical protein